MKKCPMTMSGRHMFRDSFDGWEYDGKKQLTQMNALKPKYISKCIACSTIDDRPPRKGKK